MHARSSVRTVAGAQRPRWGSQTKHSIRQRAPIVHDPHHQASRHKRLAQARHHTQGLCKVLKDLERGREGEVTALVLFDHAALNGVSDLSWGPANWFFGDLDSHRSRRAKPLHLHEEGTITAAHVQDLQALGRPTRRVEHEATNCGLVGARGGDALAPSIKRSLGIGIAEGFQPRWVERKKEVATHALGHGPVHEFWTLT